MRYKLRAVRKGRGLTQQELADKIGISRSTYVDYELGLTTPSIITAIKIKEALNYDEDDIFLEIRSEKQTKTKKKIKKDR